MKRIKILIPAILILFLISSLSFAEEKIMPLSQVKPGMQGTGLSVFKGIQPQKFKVKIIGMCEFFGMKLIVAKIWGGPNNIIKKAKVIAGMSGSPIYIKDKKIGALGYAFRNQKEAICLITPIEDMIKAGEDKTNSSDTKNTNSSKDMASIALPISSYGFTPQALELLKPFLKKQGLNLYFTDSASNGTKTTKTNQQNLTQTSIEPGEAIAVEIMGGDFGLRGVGTVTHRTKNTIYAFGHSFFGKGNNVDFPFYKAKILTVIAKTDISFKLTEKIIGPCLGSIRKDMNAGIIGILGAKPSIIPVSIHLKNNDYKKTFNVRIPKNFFAADILSLMAITNAITLEKGDVPEATIKLGMEITLEDTPLKIKTSTFTTTSKQGIEHSSLLDFYTLLYNGLKPLLEAPLEIKFKKISFTVEIFKRKLFKIHNAFLKTNTQRLIEKTIDKAVIKLKQKVAPKTLVELNLLVKEVYSEKYFISKFPFIVPGPDIQSTKIIIAVLNGKKLALLLSHPEFNLGKATKGTKSLVGLMRAIKFNAEIKPDRFYVILAMPKEKSVKNKSNNNEKDKREFRIPRISWNNITKDDISKTSMHRASLIIISPRLKAEVQGFKIFSLQIKQKQIKRK